MPTDVCVLHMIGNGSYVNSSPALKRLRIYVNDGELDHRRPQRRGEKKGDIIPKLITFSA